MHDDYSPDGDTECAEREMGGSNPIHPSNSWSPKEKRGSQCSLITPPMSVASSEPRCILRFPLDNSNNNRLLT